MRERTLDYDVLTRETSIRILILATLTIGWFTGISVDSTIYILQHGHPLGGESWFSWAIGFNNSYLPFIVIILSFLLAEWNIERKMKISSFPPEYINIQRMVLNLSDVVGLKKPPTLRFLDVGEPYAFTYGRRKSKAKIALSKGLIKILDAEELQAVISHELSHIKNKDLTFITWGTTMLKAVKFWMLGFVLLTIVGVFEIYLQGELTLHMIESYTVMIPVIVGFTAVFYIIPFLVVNSVSRIREFLADTSACRFVEERHLRSALSNIHETLILQELKRMLVPSHLSIISFSRRSILPNAVAKYTVATHPSNKDRFEDLEAKRYIKSWENVSRIDFTTIYNGVIASALMFIAVVLFGRAIDLLSISSEPLLLLQIVLIIIVPLYFVFWSNSSQQLSLMQEFPARGLREKSVGLLKMLVKNLLSGITMYSILALLVFEGAFSWSWVFSLFFTGFMILFVLYVVFTHILGPFIWSYIRQVI